MICVVLATLNLAAWRWAHPELSAAEVRLPVAGLAYSAFQRWQSPLEGRFPSTQEVAADLAILKGIAQSLRTYSASEVSGLTALARAHGLRLTAGVWLDTQAGRNETELLAIEEAVRADRMSAMDGAEPSAAGGPAIQRVIAGNETQLHQLLKPEELAAILRRLRSTLGVPVSTAEPWHVWLDRPDLVEQVDFIALHLLPYWEGVSPDVAVHEVWRRHDEVRRRYPGKPIVIAEVGWPSGGPVVEQAVPGAVNRAWASPLAQARFVREFVASAQRRDLPVDYFLMEAIDQPWKVRSEGPAGAHWGVLDARRQPKFSWSGPLTHDPHWQGKAWAATLLAGLVLWPFLLRVPHMRLSGRLAFGISAQAVATLMVVLATSPLADYLQLLDAVLLALLVPALVLMAAILLSQAFEFSELFWEGSLRRRTQALPWPEGKPAPMVSIHLPCCDEPAPMVLASLASLQKLEWPCLEIMVIDNNSRDPDNWRPVQRYVEQQRQAGDRRLQFVRLPQWPGFKAGALNEALRLTHPSAQWIAVVDSDYVVHSDWIRRLGGWFEHGNVAVVQSPQAHREWASRRLARMMNWEYEGFFRLGMHHRHERNAIVQHGTMTIIRAQALRAVGGWDAACVCEDTELGLRLLAAGWQEVYVDEVLGTGLVPHDFEAYQKQRERWARGGMQILRKHACEFLHGARLSLAQRYHFLAGWLGWLGDTLHLLFTVTALIWSLGILVAPAQIQPPLALMALPLAIFLLSRLVLVPLLYVRRVQCPRRDIIGAAWAGMALSHRIARGVLGGLFGGRARFQVTAKAFVPGRGWRTGQRAPGTWVGLRLASVAQELALGLGLTGAGFALVSSAESLSLPLLAWCGILAMQALPYVAAVSCAGLSAWETRRLLHTV